MPLDTANETQDNLDVLVRKLRHVTVKTGEDLARGEAVMLVDSFTAGTAVAGTNTGNGTVSGEVANDTATIGTYTLVALTATTFKVIDPNGIKLDAEVATGVAYDDQIGFTITAGGTAFVADDSFTILVTKGAGKVVSFATGNDPYTVMYDAVDATAGDVVGKAYRDADILASEVNFGTGTDAEVRDSLGFKNVYLMD